MVFYRLQERKFSSNIIEKGEGYIDEKGNEKIKWVPFLAPLVKKSEGDVICDQVLDFLKKDLEG